MTELCPSGCGNVSSGSRSGRDSCSFCGGVFCLICWLGDVKDQKDPRSCRPCRLSRGLDAPADELPRDATLTSWEDEGRPPAETKQRSDDVVFACSMCRSANTGTDGVCDECRFCGSALLLGGSVAATPAAPPPVSGGIRKRAAQCRDCGKAIPRWTSKEANVSWASKNPCKKCDAFRCDACASARLLCRKCEDGRGPRSSHKQRRAREDKARSPRVVPEAGEVELQCPACTATNSLCDVMRGTCNICRSPLLDGPSPAGAAGRSLVCTTCTFANDPAGSSGGRCTVCGHDLFPPSPAAAGPRRCPRCPEYPPASAEECPRCGLQLRVAPECAEDDDRRSFEELKVGELRSTLPRSFLGSAAERAVLVQPTGPRPLDALHDKEMKEADALELEWLRAESASSSSSASSPALTPAPPVPASHSTATAGRSGAVRMILLNALREVVWAKTRETCRSWMAPALDNGQLRDVLTRVCAEGSLGQRVPRSVLSDQALQAAYEALLCGLCAEGAPVSGAGGEHPVANSRLVRTLLDAGVSAGARSYSDLGTTALTLSAESGAADAARVLVERGAPEKPDYRGDHGVAETVVRKLVSSAEMTPLLVLLRHPELGRESAVVTHWAGNPLFDQSLLREVAVFLGAPTPVLLERAAQRRADARAADDAPDVQEKE